jgi:hypothetical protein
MGMAMDLIEDTEPVGTKSVKDAAGKMKEVLPGIKYQPYPEKSLKKATEIMPGHPYQAPKDKNIPIKTQQQVAP